MLAPMALPATWPPPTGWIGDRWLASAVRLAARSLGMSRPIVWSFLPRYHRIAGALDRDLLIYHCVDDYAANPGVIAERVREDERASVEQADLVLAASAPLAERLKRMRPDVHCLPNVADVQRFAGAVDRTVPEPPELASLRRPRAIYVGNLATYRFDRALLAETASRLPQVEFVLIGPTGVGDLEAAAESWDELNRRDNVHLLGPRPHGDLPAFLAHADIGLIPFLDNDHTRSCFPLKLWEMLGAGLPVVSSELPSLQGVAPPEMVVLASGADSFVRAVQKSLERAGRDRRERSEFALKHDWSERTRHLVALIDQQRTRNAN